MPTLPARVAATAERWFGHPVTITEAHAISPGLRRIAFRGDALQERRYVVGQEVEFRVSDRDFRHYTPLRFGGGTVQVVFCDYSAGPGAVWARSLQVGDEVAVMGPGGGLRLRPARRRVLLGDATTLGLFAALTAAEPHPATIGAVEVPTPDMAAAACLVPRLTVLERGVEPGEALRTWLADQRLDPDDDHAFLAGHAQSIQVLRAELRDAGMPRAAITSKAYWATGRRGL